MIYNGNALPILCRLLTFFVLCMTGIYRYCGHLVLTVDIVGVIVKVDVREKMIIYAGLDYYL